MINDLLRGTVYRSIEFMLTLYVSNIRPIIEYGSCVLSVAHLEDERKLERVQRKWTREIDGLTGLDNVSHLKKNGFNSIKGRLLRIDLIQFWKHFTVILVLDFLIYLSTPETPIPEVMLINFLFPGAE